MGIKSQDSAEKLQERVERQAQYIDRLQLELKVQRGVEVSLEDTLAYRPARPVAAPCVACAEKDAEIARLKAQVAELSTALSTKGMSTEMSTGPVDMMSTEMSTGIKKGEPGYWAERKRLARAAAKG